jgi:hydrogenase maturation protein HypF
MVRLFALWQADLFTRPSRTILHIAAIRADHGVSEALNTGDGTDRLAEWALVAVDQKKEGKIAVGGGCAMNAVPMSALCRHLEAQSMAVLNARKAPPTDGGIP